MANKRSIPEIRVRLLEIANEEDLPELRGLVDEMYRRSPNRRAPVQSDKITPSLAAQIRTYYSANPLMSFQTIADHFNVNPGRVSEAVNREI